LWLGARFERQHGSNGGWELASLTALLFTGSGEGMAIRDWEFHAGDHRLGETIDCWRDWRRVSLFQSLCHGGEREDE